MRRQQAGEGAPRRQPRVPAHEGPEHLEDRDVHQVQGEGEPTAQHHGRRPQRAAEPARGERQPTHEEGEGHTRDAGVPARTPGRAPPHAEQHLRRRESRDPRRGPVGALGTGHPADGQAGEGAGQEAATDAQDPGVREGRTTLGEGEPGEGCHAPHRDGPGDDRRRRPQSPQDQGEQREAHVGQPLGADGPGRPRPGGARVGGTVPQLDHEHLLEPVQRVQDRLQVLVGDLTVGDPARLVEQPDPEDRRDEGVHRPDAADPRPPEPRHGADGGPRSQLVEVGQRDDEAAEDEEEVHTEPAAGHEWAQGLPGPGPGVARGEAEVEAHDPRRRDDPQTRQRADLTARDGRRRRASDRGCSHEHRR